MDSLLMMALLGGLIPPADKQSERSRGSMAHKAGRKECSDADMLLDQMLGALLEAETDPQNKDCICIMQKIHTVGSSIHDLRYFADFNAGNITAKDRADVLLLLEYIDGRLSEFWHVHDKPKGTMWDKE